MSNSGRVGNVIALIIFPIIGVVFMLAGGFIFGRFGLLAAVALVVLALVYFVRQIVLVSQATSLVKSERST